MTLSDLAAIGSFISGLAVVITLAFLLLQMRQTNKNQRALMQHGRSTRNIETLARSLEPHVQPSFTRAMAGPHAQSTGDDHRSEHDVHDVHEF